MSFTIMGTGRAHPKYVLTNEKLSELVETNDEWITTRTGIKTRFIATDETVLSLATEASQRAIENAGIKAEALDLIIVSTLQADTVTPTAACMLQAAVGARCPAFDLNAACSGFLYALDTAAAYLDAGRAETILVCASEMMSKHIDWADRRTCVLFGDGAGAVVLKKGDGLKAINLTAKGDVKNFLTVGTTLGNSPFYTGQPADPFLSMDGGEVFRFAVLGMVRGVKAAIKEAGVTPEDVKYVIPHQANLRILSAAAERLHLAPEKIVVGLDRYGNTSSASIPILLSELCEDGRIMRGDILVLTAFGGGLTTGACVIKY